MKNRNLASILQLITVPVLLCMCDVSAGKGGGKPPKGDPPPPPVTYEITWLGNLGGTNINVDDINNRGQIVGSGWDELGTRRAFVLTPADMNGDGYPEYYWDGNADGINDLLVDINGMVDVDGNPTVSQGWRANRAVSINEFDQVAGTLWDSSNSVRAVYVLDLVTQRLEIIDIGTDVFAEINDLGDVAFVRNVGASRRVHLFVPGDGITNLNIAGTVMGINNNGQIVGLIDSTGAAYRHAPGQALLTLNDGISARDLNAAGTFVGQHYSGRRKQPAYRYSDAADLELLTGNKSGGANGVNLQGDTCIDIDRAGHLYTDEDGLLKLDDLVDGAVNDLANWFGADTIHASGVNDRDQASDFGQICGTARSNGIDAAFVVTPVPIP